MNCFFEFHFLLQTLFAKTVFFYRSIDSFVAMFLVDRESDVVTTFLVDRESDAFVLQKLLNFGKTRPVFRLSAPALHDEVEHLLRADVDRRAVRQEVEAVRVEPVLQVLDDLILRQVEQRLFGAECEQLPERHSERPDVALRRPQSLKIKWKKYYLFCLFLT